MTHEAQPCLPLLACITTLPLPAHTHTTRTHVHTHMPGSYTCYWVEARRGVLGGMQAGEEEELESDCLLHGGGYT